MSIYELTKRNNGIATTFQNSISLAAATQTNINYPAINSTLTSYIEGIQPLTLSFGTFGSPLNITFMNAKYTRFGRNVSFTLPFTTVGGVTPGTQQVFSTKPGIGVGSDTLLPILRPFDTTYDVNYPPNGGFLRGFIGGTPKIMISKIFQDGSFSIELNSTDWGAGLTFIFPESTLSWKV